MDKKILVFVLCGLMLLCFVACGEDITGKNPSAQSANTNETIITSEKYDNLTEPVFATDNITRITFYGYYGTGKGRDVPSEHMTEITNWLGTFTIGEKAPELLPPGTNTYYVEIEYADGTVIKNGLDLISVNGTAYYLRSDKAPDSYMEIISKTSIE